MTPRQTAELIFLGALWGASFLLLRIAVPEFGPVALIALRVGVAAAFLVIVMAGRGELPRLLATRRSLQLAIVGAVNTAIPFCLFAYATQTLTAGLASIVNATAPIWTAVVAFLWLRERLEPGRVAGLLLGVAGVAVLVSGRSSLAATGTGYAIAAGLLATLCYGVGANYARRYFNDESALVLAAGSQIASTVLLLPFLPWLWPPQPPSASAWLYAVLLGVGPTALAYILYFRLIAAVGPSRAVTVTLLIPLFGCIWGYVFLGESVSARALAGGTIVLLGTALSTGALATWRSRPI